MDRTRGNGSIEPLSLHCACGRALRVFDPTPGRVVKCPDCGAWQRVPADEHLAHAPMVSTRRRKEAGERLIDCLIYPVSDGPGIALLIVLPPVLWLMSVPVFDLIQYLMPVNRTTFNPIAVLIVPVTLPLMCSFTLFFGYILLYLGRVLVSSATGEIEQPRLPPWDRIEILEGLGRWLWAFVFGLGIGGLPVMIYWVNCGDLDLFDRIVLAELLAIGAGYAQMALAASILHDSVVAANPITIVRSIVRVGWAYVRPSLVGGFALMLLATSLYAVLFRAPNITIAGIGLWAYWVVFLYLSMAVMRLLGLTYYRHARALGWFRARPRWGVDQLNRIYVNS